VKHLLTNQRDQPVELHVGRQVRVVGPRETIEIDDDDCAAPQLGVLLKRGHVDIRAHAGSSSDERPTTTAKKGTRGNKPNAKGDE